MADEKDSREKDRTSELKTVLPFMSAFPFEDYKISMVEKGDSFIALGVSPILISAFGDTGISNIINFDYLESESNITISIYQGDLEWIAEEAVHIKKLDALRKELDQALLSTSLIDKIKAIKLGRKFMRLLNCENITEIEFGDMISDFMSIYETALPSKIKLGLQKLSEATLKSTEFSEKHFKVAESFLNFQIHYIKILLGIVIAAKIY